MSALSFNDLLAMAGVAPREVNVILHSPVSRDFAKALPALCLSCPDVLTTFQATHSQGAERALLSARPLVASFVRIDGNAAEGHSRLLFAGMFEKRGSRMRRYSEIVDEPDMRFLLETFRSGADYRYMLDEPEREQRWFDMPPVETLGFLRGRLIIGARLTPSYVRLAENLDAPVLAILEEGMFDAPPPDWRRLTLTAGEVRSLPPSWAARLAEWRGVYLIVDESDGARYVGAAYGETNLLGRWQAHTAGPQGVTRDLAARETRNFRFSILERVSPDMPAEDVIRLEQTWMDRLATRIYGLNA